MKKGLIFLLLFLFAVPGFSQDPGKYDGYKKIVLNGHVFPTIMGMRSPFVATSFKADMSAGETSVITIPSFHFDSITTNPVEGSIVFADFIISYEQRFRPWISMYLGYGLAGRYGTDVFSLLYDGINTIDGGEIGWHLRVLNHKKLMLSTRIYVKRLDGSFVSVSGFIEDLVNNVPDPAVIKYVPALGLGNSWEAAFAFNPTWGIQGSLDMMYGESFVRGKTNIIYSLNAAGDMDLYPKYNVPLGFAAGYNLAGNPEVMMDSDGHSSLFFFNLNYTGSPDFELGLQTTFYRFKLSRDDNSSSVVKATFNFRFYF